jgi:hypothetical protein
MDGFEALAEAGRTEDVTQFNRRSPNFDAVAIFANLIRKIRATDGRCEYLLPQDPGFDPNKVNLAATIDDVRFRKVANRDACDSDGQGWFFDSDDDPSLDRPRRVIACEGACKILHGNPDAGATSGNARLQIGCPTVRSTDAGR